MLLCNEKLNPDVGRQTPPRPTKFSLSLSAEEDKLPANDKLKFVGQLVGPC